MKKYILIIALIFCIGKVYSEPLNMDFMPSVFVNPAIEKTFSAGDTTFSFGVTEAKSVFFTFRDSSGTGTDSLYLCIQYTISGSVKMNSVISVHNLATTTTTTFVASSLLIPGDNSTVTYVWYPGGVSGTTATFTGTFFIARLNGVNASTPYAMKTRCVFRYE